MCEQANTSIPLIFAIVIKKRVEPEGYWRYGEGSAGARHGLARRIATRAAPLPAQQVGRRKAPHQPLAAGDNLGGCGISWPRQKTTERAG